MTEPLRPFDPAWRPTGTTAASTIGMRRARWTWAGRIPAGALTLLAGREGIGKSTIWAYLAAQITRGRLDGELAGQPRAVLVAATEDSWAHTLVPRLAAAGADLTLVFRIDDPGTYPEGVQDLVYAVNQHRAALIVLDPLMSRLDGKLDSHKDAEVRQALEPLVRAVEAIGVAIVALIHVNKSGKSDPLDTIMGSKAFTALPRSILYAIADSEDESLRHLTHVKCNLGPLVGTLPYRTRGIVVGEDDGPIYAPVLDWGEEHDQGARDLLAATAGDPETRTATGEAAAWLSDWLTTQGGQAPSADAKKAGRAAGHAERTLQRALPKAKVTTSTTSFPRVTVWTLDPSGAAQSRQQSRQPPGETSGYGVTGVSVAQLSRSTPVAPVAPMAPYPQDSGATDEATASLLYLVPPDDPYPDDDPYSGGDP